MPCSFLQPAGEQRLVVTADGLVKVVPVRINANLKTLTVEELVGQKRSMHLASFRFLIDEIGQGLERLARERGAAARWERDVERGLFGKPTVEAFCKYIVKQCVEVYARHEATGAALYASDEVFRSLVIETLECKAHAQSKLLWWLEDEAQSISAQGVYGSATTDRAGSLRAAHRGRIAFLEGALPRPPQRRTAAVRPCSRTAATAVVRPEAAWWAADRVQAALELCKVKGLVRESVEETNELGETVFVRAANEGESLRVLELLVEARADVNACNAQDRGATALFYAAKRGDVERVQQLHRLGAGLEPVVNGTQTPLIIAAGQGLTATVLALAQLRADVAAMPVYGITALKEATRGGYAETARVLRELGAAK